jgi:archaetidylinositol phosphate synthase
MVSGWIRLWSRELLRPLLELLTNLGVTPNFLTLSGLVLMILAGLLFALDQRTVGTGLLILGAFLDGIDGSLAQVSGLESPLGAFLDSVCDHCGDFAIYLGLMWHYLKNNAQTEVLLLFIALFGSVFGSHVRSRAGMVGIDTKLVGIFTRFERTTVLVIGILVQRVGIALWALAIFNGLSALQRVLFTIWVSRNRVKAG